MRGREETMGGGREETAGRGHPRGGAGAEGAGVAIRQVTGGIPAVPMEGGETEGGGHGRLVAMPWLPVKEDGKYSGVSFFLYFNFANDFLREGRRVCKACATAKQRCTTAGGDTIKVSQKKMEDVEEGSSSRKK